MRFSAAAAAFLAALKISRAPHDNGLIVEAKVKFVSGAGVAGSQ